MRPDISDETMRFLDMAVLDELEHKELFNELDTDAKIQVLLRSWKDAHRERAKNGPVGEVWHPPWSRNKHPDGRDAPTPPWQKVD